MANGIELAPLLTKIKVDTGSFQTRREVFSDDCIANLSVIRERDL